MYRSCIFCSADLKANDALERFPVGRSIAFDGEKGRLWAVCPKCARWNLAPIEERWEAMEDAERLFRDTRTRVQRENIGLAKLRDGTRLIRVGAALPGELAVWRYGESLVRRRRRSVITGSLSSVAFLGFYFGGPLLAAGLGIGGYVGSTAAMFIREAMVHANARKLVHTVSRPDGDRPGAPLHLRRRDVAGARLGYGGDGVELHLPAFTREAEEKRFTRVSPDALVLRGPEAHMAMSRVMVLVNGGGGTRRDLEDALDAITVVGSPGEMLQAAARKRLNLDGSRQQDTGAGVLRDPKFSNGSLDELRWPNTSVPSPTLSLALEMALHHETERRALDGELAALEEMWRQAEEIAAIVDRLDHAARHPATSR